MLFINVDATFCCNHLYPQNTPAKTRKVIREDHEILNVKNVKF